MLYLIQMSFATIDTSYFPKSSLQAVGKSFIRHSESKTNEINVQNHIEVLGGDGKMALKIIEEWIESPYRSTLRWAVARMLGKNVEDVLKITLERSKTLFNAGLQSEVDRWMKSSAGFYEQYTGKYLSTRYLPDSLERLRFKANMSQIARKKIVDSYQVDLKNAYQEIISSKPVQNIEAYLKVDVYRFMEYVSNLKREYDEDTLAVRNAAKMASDPSIQKTVLCMVALCQSVYQTNRTLYRGICCKQGDEIYRRAKASKSVSILCDSVISFTEYKEAARQFAEGDNSLLAVPGRGVIVSAEIQPQFMVATPEVFSALAVEGEYIVATHGSIDVDKRHIEAA